MSFDDLTVPQLTDDLLNQGYIADRGLATSVLLALKLGKPLLLEGEVGVGKTELAKTLATMLGRDLIRLQCYEGIDVHHALYEWDYARQMLHIRALGQPDRGGLAGPPGRTARDTSDPPRSHPGLTGPHRRGTAPHVAAGGSVPGRGLPTPLLPCDLWARR